MLDELAFVAGPAPGAEPLVVRPNAVTVLVGPNNCGKSLALQELDELLREHPGRRLQKAPSRVVRSVAFKKVEDRAAVEALLRLVVVGEDEMTLACSNPIAPNRYENLSKEQQISIFPQLKMSDWAHVLGNLLSVRLDGPSRLGLMASQVCPDAIAPPTNHLWALFQRPEQRERLRALVHEAFGRHLVIDPTAPGHLRVRLADRAPVDEAEEQALDLRARTYHSSAIPIEAFSEGVRAYAGLLAALLAVPARVMLVDEPDAFLHPPLARRLGYHVAKLAAERDAQVFAATHSAEFLMGCIESGANVDIVRLTYRSGVATARHLPSTELQELMRDPLTRSANVLASLFHEGAVVTEADTDRAFYQEINHRLITSRGRSQPTDSTADARPVAEAPERDGADACMFLNAQNKQTVHRIIAPLRRLGVPAAAIVDIDVLKEGGVPLANFLKAANVPRVTRSGMETMRANLLARFKAAAKDMKKDGIDALGESDKNACRDFFDSLEVYGLFVVDVGEVERWLRQLNVSGWKSEWLINMFERLGADPTAPRYVWPKNGDVWDFMRRVARWLRDPNRRGLAID